MLRQPKEETMLTYAREFSVLAETLNYTAASMKLNVSQPSLSRHIIALENELGFQLFTRNPLALTAAGKQYLESMYSLIKRYDEIVEECRKIEQGDGKPLLIYMTPTLTMHAVLTSKTMAIMRSKNPRFSSEVCTNDRYHTIQEAVKIGLADVGIVFDLDETANNPALSYEKFLTMKACVWVQSNNPLAKSGTIALSDLAPYALVRSTNRLSQTWSNASEELLRANGIEPNVHLKDHQNYTEFFMDLGKDEYLCSEENFMEISLLNPDLVKLSLKEEEADFSCYVIFRKDDTRPIVRQFRETLLKVAADHSPTN